MPLLLKRAIAGHPVGKALVSVKVPVLLKVPLLKKIIVPVGGGVTAPGGVAGIHGAPTRKDPAEHRRSLPTCC